MAVKIYNGINKFNIVRQHVNDFRISKFNIVERDVFNIKNYISHFGKKVSGRKWF